ncbi:MAG: elongation factor G [Pseudomonadales bacterium]|nr:elongation factor G [Pseudomonadales bacterium]
MASYTTESIRNIALAGHAGAGKTILAENLLQQAGVIQTAGTIERGNTVCDFDPQEQRLQHSLDAALCSFDHAGSHVNLLDTPGYPDFIGRAVSVLPAVESVAIVVNAQMGIEQLTRRMMEEAVERKLCRMIVINKIDSDGVDLPGLLAELQEQFGAECLPINLPAGGGQEVVDCFFNPSDKETDFASVDEAHTAIVDQVVEVDEELMELYLEQGEELDPEQLHEPFEEALREGHLVPVCFTSAATGAGVPELLDVFARLMPNPLEANPPQFLLGEGDDAEPVEVVPDADRHVVAHVFKVMVDPYVGKLGLFRIHQGTVKSGSQLYIGDARKPFKIAHLLKLQGQKHTDVDEAVPGDICGVSKVDEIHFDAVLHDSHDEDHYHLQMEALHPPMCGLAIQTTRRGDEQKLSDALNKLTSEDPSLRLEHRAALNETVLYGTGDLHLRCVLEKMAEQYNVEVQTQPPSIAYRETITAQAEGHSRHKKQTGGAGQFGEVYLRVEPLERGSGFEFVDQIVGGVIPNQFIPAVEKGVKQVLESGAVAGYAMQDVRVTVYDGKHHPVDSKEVAFVAAGRKAFLDAITKAKPQVLEPVVNVKVIAPGDSMGDITGDLSGRRGVISSTSMLAQNRAEISAQVPLAELDNYQSQLNSMTGGEGSYTMEFSHYAPVPDKVQQDLASEYRPEAVAE